MDPLANVNLVTVKKIVQNCEEWPFRVTQPLVRSASWKAKFSYVRIVFCIKHTSWLTTQPACWLVSQENICIYGLVQAQHVLCLVQPVWQTRMEQSVLENKNVADGKMREVIYSYPSVALFQNVLRYQNKFLL